MTRYLILFIDGRDELRLTSKFATTPQEAVNWFTDHRNYRRHRIVGVTKVPNEHLHLGLHPVRDPMPAKEVIHDDLVTLDWFGG